MGFLVIQRIQRQRNKAHRTCRSRYHRLAKGVICNRLFRVISHINRNHFFSRIIRNSLPKSTNLFNFHLHMNLGSHHSGGSTIRWAFLPSDRNFLAGTVETVMNATFLVSCSMSFSTSSRNSGSICSMTSVQTTISQGNLSFLPKAGSYSLTFDPMPRFNNPFTQP